MKRALVLIALVACHNRQHPSPGGDPHDNTWMADYCPPEYPELWIGGHSEMCCDGTTYKGCQSRRPIQSVDDNFCIGLPIYALGVHYDELHLMRDGTWMCCAPGQSINCGN